jgi:glycosyltransferase involved in cell wall biosynthesis
MSRVDVVIPCYNYGRYLTECVSSVLDDQPGSDVRVLIIDDASRDDSVEVARKLAAGDSRVEVAVHPVNMGAVPTYNEGLLEWASSHYCLLISADDKLVPGALRRATEFLDARPSVGFVYGNIVRFSGAEDEPPRARLTVQNQRVFNGHRWLKRRFRESKNPVAAPAVVARTSLQHQVGGYNPRLPHTGDAEMWMRMAARADVGYLNVDQAFYRRHGSNMSHGLDDYVVRFRQWREAYEAALEYCDGVVPDVSRLSRSAHRLLAHEALWVAVRAYDRRRTGWVPVDELVAFAFDCWPDTASLGIYRTLQLRRSIGPRITPYLQPLVWSAVIREVRDGYRRYSSPRRGF